MNKVQMFIGQFFGKTHKALSESEDDTGMKEFEVEAQGFAEMLGTKDTKIAELEGKLALAEGHAAKIVALEGQLASEQKVHEATGLRLEAEEKAHKATQAALAVFGETPEARAKYAAEKERMDTWYADDKRQKDAKGNDLGDDLNNGGKETREEREARIAEIKKNFGKTFHG